MKPVDVDLHLFAIGKFLDGKGMKPPDEEHKQVVSFLESETAAHPEDANITATLDSVKTMWEACQGFISPATPKVGQHSKDEDLAKVNDGLKNEKRRGSSVADKLKQAVGHKDNGEKPKIDLFAELAGSYFSTPQGLAFYVGANKIPIGVDSQEFGGILTNLKYQAIGIPATDTEISKVQRLAKYHASKNIRDIGVRSARDGDAIVYDPVRPDGHVYAITKSGIALKIPDTPCTVRYVGMLEAVIEDGSLQDHLSLIRLWHLDQKSEILSMGLDFSRFIPSIPHAIENIDGAHGSGKTLYTETKRTLYDPNGASTQSLKYDERDLSISALHQGMLAFDNVNAAIPDYISDIICRFTTGQGFRTRELYSNTGETILKLKKAIIINGINRASYRADFLDRECPIHLSVMPEARRLTDAEIRDRADMLIPKVRGFLLSVIPRALELYPQVEAELKGRLPRMADIVLWAECGLRAMGFPAMAFFDAYATAKHEEIQEVARDTLLIGAIQALMAGRDEWAGTTSDLLNDLESLVTDSQKKSKAFPKDARRLGRSVRELEPTLREIGLEITADNSDKNERKKVIRKLTPPEIPKVNVGNPTDPLKSDVQKPTLTSDITDIKNPHSGSEKITKSQPDLAQSAVQNENPIVPITAEEVKSIIQDLITDGFDLLTKEPTPDMGGKNYKIGITKPADAARLETLQDRLKSLGFEQVNPGSFGVLFFSKPLRRDGA